MKRTPRFILVVALLLPLFPPLVGCTGNLGTRLVRTDNHGQHVDQLSGRAAAPAVDGGVIDHRFRVEVASPPASLSVWVIDPVGEPRQPAVHPPIR